MATLAFGTTRNLRFGAQLEPVTPYRLRDLTGCSYDLAVVRLEPDRDGRFAFSDLSFPAQAIASRFIGYLASTEGEELRAGLGFARHLELAAVVVELAADPAQRLDQARSVLEHLAAPDAGRVWLSVPWAAPGRDTWAEYSALRSALREPLGVGLCLRITGETPETELVERWAHEPLEALLVETGAAPPALERLFKNPLHVVLFADQPRAAYDTALAVLARYDTAWAGSTERERFDVDFRHQVLPPVQPLRDHIHARVYEHFEQAEIKYQAYEDAIAAALSALSAPGKKRPVVVVAGAGRGPIVSRARAAAERTGIAIELHAVEKNPYSASLLGYKNAESWNAEVRVHSADMRSLSFERPVDLLVSELLGGFGDNELSPECLVEPERWLSPQALMIPACSRSYLAPVSAPLTFRSIPAGPGQRERGWAIDPAAARPLAAPKLCFTFEHPRGAEKRLDRTIHLEFVAERGGRLHGFLGTFEADLFGNERISIHPETDTGTRSWAPVLFPLESPRDVAAGDRIRCAFWRRNDGRKVWYEWACPEPGDARIHNAAGAFDALGL